MSFKKLVLYFLGWRLVLLLFLFLSIPLFQLQIGYLGGGTDNYLTSPQLWSWLNFDGEHYLSLATEGYRSLTYFYFPLYPKLVGTIVKLFNNSFINYAVFGLFISNLSFLVGLVGLIKLIKIDFSNEIAFITILLILFFPTSFYFGSFYTESIFFALAVWGLYFARKRKWLAASLLAGLSSATRIVGIALVPALVVEVFLENKKTNGEKITRSLWVTFISLSGLLLYMYFLKIRTEDPLEFFRTISIFGQQRSSEFVLLPQVFYRYIFKILPSVDYSYFPAVFTTLLEFIAATFLLLLCVISFIKLRLSYALYLTGGYLLPTLSGSFSSLPRYLLVLFPAFILSALYISKLNKNIQIAIYCLLFILSFLATSLFVRGYWIA